MEERDLKRLEEIIFGLPENDQEIVREYQENMRRHAMRAAAAAIMVRNFSHNIGTHLLGRCL